MFNFETFWYNWFGKNPALSNAQSVVRKTLKALDKEIKKQKATSQSIGREIHTLSEDKNRVDSIVSALLKEHNSLSNKK